MVFLVFRSSGEPSLPSPSLLPLSSPCNHNSEQVFFVVMADDMSDYYNVTSTNGSVSFSDGQSFMTLEIQILPNTIPEHNEMFTVTLTWATAGTTINSVISFAKLTIRSGTWPDSHLVCAQAVCVCVCVCLCTCMYMYVR